MGARVARGSWDGHDLATYYVQLASARAATASLAAPPFLLLSYEASSTICPARGAGRRVAGSDGSLSSAENVERAAPLCSREEMAARSSNRRLVARGAAA